VTRFLGLAAYALCALTAAPVSAQLPHLELEVQLDPASREMRAIAVLEARGEMRLRLHRSLALRAVEADGVPVAFARERQEADRVLWRLDVRPGATLRVDYGGILPALDRALDHRRVLRDRTPMASPGGSFLPAGTGWYPVPARLFTYRVTVSVPAGQRAVVPGRLAAEQWTGSDPARYQARFEFDHPADGIDLMAGPYAVAERLRPRRGGAPVRLRTYFYREVEALADGYLDDSWRYIERYSRSIGEYPFTEFSVVASPLPTGFGMPTLTYIGTQVLKLPFIRGTSLGHEVLHNWWGNGVYPDYAKGNWSEGLTTFMADYAYREEASPEAARDMRLGWLRDFAAVPAGEERPLAEFRSRAHGVDAPVGYGKAAMVFLMLRDLLGRDAFDRGLRLFWRSHRFEIASWDDLRTAFEQTSGQGLRGFFEQWVERPGGPDVRIAAARAIRVGAGAKLILFIDQSAPAYRLRVPIEIVTGRNAELRWLDVDQTTQSVTLGLGRTPDGVRLDPELRLWRRLPAEQLPPILRRWILADAVRLAVAGDDESVRAAANLLAEHVLESKPNRVPLTDLNTGDDPALIVGVAEDVDAALARLGLPPRPARLTRGTAQVWTIERGAATPPVAVISARDVASLRALVRPLPHYGAQSFLVFDGAHTVERGVWAASGRLIPVTR
jgi:aminopeptidase N